MTVVAELAFCFWWLIASLFFAREDLLMIVDLSSVGLWLFTYPGLFYCWPSFSVWSILNLLFLNKVSFCTMTLISFTFLIFFYSYLLPLINQEETDIRQSLCLVKEVSSEIQVPEMWLLKNYLWEIKYCTSAGLMAGGVFSVSPDVLNTKGTTGNLIYTISCVCTLLSFPLEYIYVPGFVCKLCLENPTRPLGLGA